MPCPHIPREGGLAPIPDSLVQPFFDYNLFSAPYDRERVRDSLRAALCIARQPAMDPMVVERLSPTDRDFASGEALDNWILRDAYTQHHISRTYKMGQASD